MLTSDLRDGGGEKGVCIDSVLRVCRVVVDLGGGCGEYRMYGQCVWSLLSGCETCVVVAVSREHVESLLRVY